MIYPRLLVLCLCVLARSALVMWFSTNELFQRSGFESQVCPRPLTSFANVPV